MTPEDDVDESETPKLELAGAEAMLAGGAPCEPLLAGLLMMPEDGNKKHESPQHEWQGV